MSLNRILTFARIPLLSVLVSLLPCSVIANQFRQPDPQSFPQLYQWTDTCNVYVLRDGDHLKEPQKELLKVQVNDVDEGGSYDDTIDGGEGDDLLVGQRGDDLIKGDDGEDVLIGDQDSVETVYGPNLVVTGSFEIGQSDGTFGQGANTGWTNPNGDIETWGDG